MTTPPSLETMRKLAGGRLATPRGGHASSRPATHRFLPLEAYPRLVLLAQQPAGKAGIFVMFALLLAPLNTLWLPISIAAAASGLAGRHRGLIVATGTLAVWFLQPGWFDWTAPQVAARHQGLVTQIDLTSLRALMISVVLLLSVAVLYWGRLAPRMTLARRPVLTLLTIVLALMTIGSSGILQGYPLVLLWSFVSTLVACMWFLSYALVEQRSTGIGPPVVQLGAFHAFWGSSKTPIGKGAAYLKKVEAQDHQELAVAQLTGLKLIAWTTVLSLLWHPVRILSIDVLQLPTLDLALERHVAGQPYPWHICWAATVYAFFESMLSLVVWGNACVAAARIAGYRLLRNTWRPLSATTFAEFWNRYYYYYKELLVDFFFFPTFLRCFKRHQRLRLFFATFMAAGVGNFLYHFTRDARYVADLGLGGALRGFQAFGFYCATLGIAIGISQMRSAKRAVRKGWLRRQFIPSLTVLLFYCLMQVFMHTYSPFSLGDHFSFVLRLLGSDVWM